MIFSVLCMDDPAKAALRLEVRPTHVAYLTSLGTALVLGGPFLAEDGKSSIGSFLLIDAPDQATAAAIAAKDPYAEAGLFASVTVRPYRIVFLNPPAA